MGSGRKGSVVEGLRKADEFGNQALCVTYPAFFHEVGQRSNDDDTPLWDGEVSELVQIGGPNLSQ